MAFLQCLNFIEIQMVKFLFRCDGRLEGKILEFDPLSWLVLLLVLLHFLAILQNRSTNASTPFAAERVIQEFRKAHQADSEENDQVH